MKKLSFSDMWISWIAALYRDVESSVLVNRKRLSKFKVQTSVR